jgi:hypothetical protein
MGEEAGASGKLLLMGSSAYKAEELPDAVKDLIDEVISRGMTIIVGEAHGACRRYQDYLRTRGYGDVIVGHARSVRYNAGGWRTVKYGDDLKERERRMIEDCDSAIVIWVDNSGVIAKNLELLKKLGKPTYVYEYSTKDDRSRFGEIDPTRVYSLHRPVLARADVDVNGLREIIDAFLVSNDEQLLVECENPGLTGYYLNKLILERNFDNVLEVKVDSESCYIKRKTQ